MCTEGPNPNCESVPGEVKSWFVLSVSIWIKFKLLQECTNSGMGLVRTHVLYQLVGLLCTM